jgi:hypothetical protein
MKFVYDDGGRANCGFKGTAGDCVARSISIASQLPYNVVYNNLAQINLKMRKTKRRCRGSVGHATASDGIYTNSKLFKDYMTNLGFVWTSCMQIGSGCKVHLTDGELPDGRLVVSVSKHLTAVIDGVIHDNHDPQREAWFNVAGPHHPDGDREPILELGETKNINGVWRVSRRCVYGYYTWQK